MIDVQRAHTYLHNKYFLKPSSKGWYSYTCPVCAAGGYKNIMGVNFGSEHVKCWSPSCQFGKGSITDFVMFSENLPSPFDARMFIANYEPSLVNIEQNNVRRLVDKVDVTLPKGFSTILSGSGPMAIKARRYLANRGFDLKLMDREGFGYCSESDKNYHKDYYGYIIVPFIIEGKLRYFLGRDFLDREPKNKYKNPKFDVFGVEKSEWLFNEDAINMYKEIFLNEGWADARTIGNQGVSTQGWNLSEKQKSKLLRSNIERLVVVADRGAYLAAVKTALAFVDKKKVFVVNFDDPILADFGKDVNEVGLDRFYKGYQKTKQMTRKRAMEILTNK